MQPAVWNNKVLPIYGSLQNYKTWYASAENVCGSFHKTGIIYTRQDYVYIKLPTLKKTEQGVGYISMLTP